MSESINVSMSSALLRRVDVVVKEAKPKTSRSAAIAWWIEQGVERVEAQIKAHADEAKAAKAKP